MTETRKSVTTKSIRYLYDIEYIKHYNYYEDVELCDGDAMVRTCDENQNCAPKFEPMSGRDSPNFASEDEENDTVPDLSFSFVRVSIYFYASRVSLDSGVRLN